MYIDGDFNPNFKRGDIMCKLTNNSPDTNYYSCDSSFGETTLLTYFTGNTPSLQGQVKYRTGQTHSHMSEGQIAAVLSVASELSMCASDWVLMHHQETTWLPVGMQNGGMATAAKMSG